METIILSDNKLRLYIQYRIILEQMEESSDLGLLPEETFINFTKVDFLGRIPLLNTIEEVKIEADGLYKLMDKQSAIELETYISDNFNELKIACLEDYKNQVLSRIMN